MSALKLIDKQQARRERFETKMALVVDNERAGERKRRRRKMRETGNCVEMTERTENWKRELEVEERVLPENHGQGSTMVRAQKPLTPRICLTSLANLKLSRTGKRSNNASS